MEDLNHIETECAVKSLLRLKERLQGELGRLEALLHADTRQCDAEHVDWKAFEQACYMARARVLGGIASVDEVLAWVHLMAETKADGTELDAVKMLPVLRRPDAR